MQAPAGLQDPDSRRPAGLRCDRRRFPTHDSCHEGRTEILEACRLGTREDRSPRLLPRSRMSRGYSRRQAGAGQRDKVLMVLVRAEKLASSQYPPRSFGRRAWKPGVHLPERHLGRVRGSTILRAREPASPCSSSPDHLGTDIVKAEGVQRITFVADVELATTDLIGYHTHNAMLSEQTVHPNASLANPRPTKSKCRTSPPPPLPPQPLPYTH